MIILLLSIIVIISCELLKRFLLCRAIAKEQAACHMSSLQTRYTSLLQRPMAYQIHIIKYEGSVRQGKDIWIELNLQLGFDNQARESLLSFRKDEVAYLEEVNDFFTSFQEELEQFLPEALVKLNDILLTQRYMIDFAKLHPSKKSRSFQEYYTYEELEQHLKSPLYDTIKEYWTERERRKLKAAKKRNLKKTAEYTCAICHQVLKSSELTIDHIIPVSKWGRSEPWNLQVLCSKCNKSKKDVTPDNWKDLVGNYVSSIEDIEPRWVV